MGREALLIWVSPRQNFSNPPPVPEKPTFTRALVALLYSSATASEIGKTVDEPSIRITWLSKRQAATRMATTTMIRMPVVMARGPCQRLIALYVFLLPDKKRRGRNDTISGAKGEGQTCDFVHLMRTYHGVPPRSSG